MSIPNPNKKQSESPQISKFNPYKNKVPKNMVFASYLPSDITEPKLKEIFGQVGQIKEINIKSKMDGFTFAYITYFNENDATLALATLKNTKIDANYIRVKPYQPNVPTQPQMNVPLQLHPPQFKPNIPVQPQPNVPFQPKIKRKYQGLCEKQLRIKMEQIDMQNSSRSSSPHLTSILKRYSKSLSPVSRNPSSIFLKKKPQYYQPYEAKKSTNMFQFPQKPQRQQEYCQMSPFPFMMNSSAIMGYIPIIYFPQNLPMGQTCRHSRKKRR